MAESLVIIHGRPGSGKSELSRAAIAQRDQWLPEGVPLRHLSIGNRYRSILRGEVDSLFAAGVHESAKQGISMTPHDPELVHELVKEYLDGLDTPGVTLLDGYPKEPELADAVKRDFTGRLHPVKGLVLVQVASHVALERVLGRTSADLHPDIDEVQARARVDYHDHITEEVVGDLSAAFGGYEINGEQTFGGASTELIAALGQIMAASADD